VIRDIVTAIVVGFTHWYLANYRDWERERVRLWELGFPWMAMPDEPEENRRLGLTRTEMRCRLVQVQFNA
jgi:hypothetical protein